jgi:hypothetical protein
MSGVKMRSKSNLIFGVILLFGQISLGMAPPPADHNVLNVVRIISKAKVVHSNKECIERGSCFYEQSTIHGLDIFGEAQVIKFPTSGNDKMADKCVSIVSALSATLKDRKQSSFVYMAYVEVRVSQSGKLTCQIKFTNGQKIKMQTWGPLGEAK